MKPRSVASSQTGRRGHEVRHASIVSGTGAGPGRSTRGGRGSGCRRSRTWESSQPVAGVARSQARESRVRRRSDAVRPTDLPASPAIAGTRGGRPLNSLGADSSGHSPSTKHNTGSIKGDGWTPSDRNASKTASTCQPSPSASLEQSDRRHRAVCPCGTIPQRRGHGSCPCIAWHRGRKRRPELSRCDRCFCDRRACADREGLGSQRCLQVPVRASPLRPACADSPSLRRLHIAADR